MTNWLARAIMVFFTYWQMHLLTGHAEAMELAVLILFWVFIYIHTFCIQAAKDLLAYDFISWYCDEY